MHKRAAGDEEDSGLAGTSLDNNREFAGVGAGAGASLGEIDAGADAGVSEEMLIVAGSKVEEEQSGRPRVRRRLSDVGNGLCTGVVNSSLSCKRKAKKSIAALCKYKQINSLPKHSIDESDNWSSRRTFD